MAIPVAYAVPPGYGMMNGNDLIFRRVRDTDLPAIQAFVSSPQELFLFAPAARYPLSIDALEVIVHRRLHSSVLVYESQVAGFANFYNFEPGEYLFLGNVVIHPGLRGKGLGNRLVRFMLDDMFVHFDVAEARLSVFSHNHTAMNLYTSLGFQIYANEWRMNPLGEKVLLHHMQLYRDYYLARNVDS